MDQSQARTTYATLAEVLRDLGLTWITDEVTEAAARGLTEEVPRDDLRELLTDVDLADFRAGWRKDALLRTRPYTAREELRLLLDALDKVVRDVENLSDAASQFLRDVHKDDVRVRPRLSFVSDAPDAAPGLTLTGEDPKSAKTELDETVSALRQMI